MFDYPGPPTGCGAATTQCAAGGHGETPKTQWCQGGLKMIDWHRDKKTGQVLRCNRYSRWLLATGCVCVVALLLFFEYRTLASFGYIKHG